VLDYNSRERSLAPGKTNQDAKSKRCPYDRRVALPKPALARIRKVKRESHAIVIAIPKVLKQ
jgi:hypothetical protein